MLYSYEATVQYCFKLNDDGIVFSPDFNDSRDCNECDMPHSYYCSVCGNSFKNPTFMIQHIMVNHKYEIESYMVKNNEE